MPCNRTMGRVIAKAWCDAEFKSRLIAEPISALAQLDIAVPPGTAIVARENTDTALHLVTCARPLAMPSSALSDIRDFAEIYRDPRLWSLNWLGRDPVGHGRAWSPIRWASWARSAFIRPRGWRSSLLVNTPALTHLILPPLPPERALHAPPVRAPVGRTRAGRTCASADCSGPGRTRR